MSPPRNVSLENFSTDGGHVAGNNLPINAPEEFSRYLARLYEQLKVEIRDSLEATEDHEEFKRYLYTKDKFLGLEEKLEKGRIEFMLTYAEETKESFAKHVQKYQMYDSARKVFTFLLSKVETIHTTHILPNIEDLSPKEIIERIETHIAVQIEKTLGSNDLEILPRQIHGMYYYLVGKCILKLHTE